MREPLTAIAVKGRESVGEYASSCIGSYSNKVLIRHERALAARLMSQIGLFCTAAQGGPGRRQIDSSRTPGGRPAAAGLPSHTSPVR